MNMTNPKKILVVEDDASLSGLLAGHLKKMGFAVTTAATGKDARRIVDTVTFDLILLDIRLPDCSGLELLVELLPRAPVVTITAYGSVDQAVRAVKTGASDYLVKPVSYDALEISLERAFETAELKRDVAYWQSQAQRATRSAIIGESDGISEVRSLIDVYADAGSTVLIEGESGTGKELVARSLHEASDRGEGRFIPVDCDPSQENMTAAELFGVEQGAYAGASSRREGMLEFADSGTLYLGDIAEISPALQTKILRVLETGTFRRLGGAEDLSTNARIVVGTSYNLHELVKQGKFRSELFFRLSAFCIRIPPLRERKEDILALARYFLDARSFKRGTEKELADETLEALKRYDWPGNVRELRNSIERGVIVSGTERTIMPRHVSIGSGTGINAQDRHGDGDASVVLRFSEEPTMEQLRARYLRFLLDRHDGNRRKVAGILGISERNTYRLIPRLTSNS